MRTFHTPYVALIALTIAALAFLVQSCACGRLRSQLRSIEYKDGDVVLEGFVAFDSEKTNAPGVLVVHQWMGLTDYEKGRCKQLAELGYVAFALDIYGKGQSSRQPRRSWQKGGRL